MFDLAGRTIALCVTGSIAAYKSVEVARLCVKAGATVLPVMTHSAAHFVGPVTLSGICGVAVAQDMWDPGFSGEMHVAISERADAVVIVPATADLLSRMAAGRADDLVTALALSAKGPVLAAPAMHPRMWLHPATQRNVDGLARDCRVQFVGPVSGPVASGDSGPGRMAEPQEIFEALARILTAPAVKDLAGKHVVVTAGPTVEDLDPVRYLGNRSTGKMGFAVAERAALRGAEVTLIAGPVTLATPSGVARVDVRSALDMREALWRALGDDLTKAHALVMTAAVADYRPAVTSPVKLKKLKDDKDESSLALVKNPDLLAEVGAKRDAGKAPVLVGFAVETGTAEQLVAYARGKLAQKKCDLIVANEARVAFAGDDNRATMVSASGAESLGDMSKRDLADRILDRVAEALKR
ncbi:bifunctional phosphopantothenoylcysteine decarboxylase/phosphopantothenate--cysteine ligase CoaBC [Pendulispora brunnea]|uniref:Coenzyme A biosynthesis bifunctional protein CoaBC n=1 Tax=Pendulispora brunnea TaxID=2905690 RepID=A0ABZ2KIB4_9BACT